MRKRVLYVEDQEDLRFLVRSVLINEGYHVDCAVNGAEALQQLHHSESPYDLIITDNQMPILTGLELVRRVREIAYPAKIIALSGNLTPASASLFKALNVDCLLHKPCAIDDIVFQVKKVLVP